MKILSLAEFGYFTSKLAKEVACDIFFIGSNWAFKMFDISLLSNNLIVSWGSDLELICIDANL